jgi:uncharacterized membrane protein
MGPDVHANGRAVRNRRNPMRQWLGIEVTAYVLVCLSLVTVAWANDRVSGLAESAALMIAACVLTLALRGIYRRRRRP